MNPDIFRPVAIFTILQCTYRFGITMCLAIFVSQLTSTISPKSSTKYFLIAALAASIHNKQSFRALSAFILHSLYLASFCKNKNKYSRQFDVSSECTCCKHYWIQVDLHKNMSSKNVCRQTIVNTKFIYWCMCANLVFSLLLHVHVQATYMQQHINSSIWKDLTNLL